MQDLLNRLRAFDALRDVPGGERVDKVLTRSLTSHPPELAPQSYLD